MNNTDRAKQIIEDYKNVFEKIRVLENKMKDLQEERNVLLKKLETLRNNEMTFMESLNDNEKNEIVKNIQHG